MWNALHSPKRRLSQVPWTTLRLKFMSKGTDAVLNCVYLLIDEKVDMVGFSKIVHHVEYEYISRDIKVWKF